jgi:DNA adenine methylase
MIQPLKWHGGKHYLAAKIIALMPAHMHYVEPYFGGGVVMLEKDPVGVSEVVNDIDGRLINFWRVLQDKGAFLQFSRAVQATPFAEAEFEQAAYRQDPRLMLDVDAAAAFFIRCRQSRAGNLREFATLSRNRIRRQMNEQVSAWWSCVDGLAEVHARLKRVVIFNRRALDVIRQQDGPNTLFYLDPPYLSSTRATTGNYRHEMTEADHVELLRVIKKCKGNVLLSGYVNDLYDHSLADWRRHEFKIDNKVSGAKTKRTMTEVVWTNRGQPAGRSRAMHIMCN